VASYADILPDQTEQIFVCGQKGSGKTTLIKRLLSLLKDELIIIVDSKPDWDDLAPMFGPNRKNKPRKLDMKFLWTLNSKDASGVYVYQCPPDRPAYADKNVERLIFWAIARYDRIKGWTGKKVGMTIVVDELGDFAKASYTTPAMSKLIRQGRSKRVRTFLGSQRPSGIPQIAIDQSQRFCVFMLMNQADRKRLASWVHPRLEQMATGRDFWYYEIPRDRDPKPLTLMHQNIEKRKLPP
jgi:DNA helicase HerA-like ATPase